MNKIINSLKSILYNKLNYKRVFLFMAFSAIITALIYTKSHIGYSAVSDFFSGSSIYDNHNKYFDKWLPYIYTAIFFILYSINFEKIFGYIFSFMEKINNRPVSVIWKVLAIIFALAINFHFFSPEIPADNYHFGESLVGQWLINEHSYIVYKDIFPPHGLYDVIPGWIGTNIFQNNTIYGVLIGTYTLNYILLAILAILAFTTLPFEIAVIGIIALPYFGATLPGIYLLTLLLLIKKQKLKENFYLYSIFACASSYLLYVYCPTYGAPFILTLTIPFFRNLRLYIQNTKTKNIIIYSLLFIAINCGIVLYFKDFFINNFSFILSNFSTNMLSFGTTGQYSTADIILKCAQYLLVPLFMLMLFEEIKKQDKNSDRIIFLSVLLLYPFLISTYSLGRMDGNMLSRSVCISYIYLLLFIPLLIKNTLNSKYYNYCLILLVGISCYCIFNGNCFNIKKTEISPPQTTIFRNGKAVFQTEHLQNLYEISDYINANAKTDYTFLDLTNQGALYFYLQKQPLIPYLAYYNIPSPKQDRTCAEKISQNLPDIVLINANNIKHDDLPLSLRAYNIYKTILSSEKYTVLSNGNITILKKVQNHRFTDKEIILLEEALGHQNLHQLPDIYGKSLKRLSSQLTKKPITYTTSVADNILTIKFDKPIAKNNIDYLYFKTSKKHNNITVRINREEIILKTKRKNCLIPLFIHPAIMLNPIKEIQIELKNLTDKSVKNIEFYERNK